VGADDCLLNCRGFDKEVDPGLQDCMKRLRLVVMVGVSRRTRFSLEVRLTAEPRFKDLPMWPTGSVDFGTVVVHRMSLKLGQGI
jgi:hypothetical protein